MARKRNSDSRCTTGLTSSQQRARRAAQRAKEEEKRIAAAAAAEAAAAATAKRKEKEEKEKLKKNKGKQKQTEEKVKTAGRDGKSHSTASASPPLPRYQLKVLTPCARHNTDIVLPSRPQAALLAPFYLRHWHIGLEHHLFTDDLIAENSEWQNKYFRASARSRRKRSRLPASVLAKLKWSSQNIIWPAERWLAEVPHVVLGRHQALPSAYQLRHSCVGRVHARLVYIQSPIMHRFFTENFPRLYVARAREAGEERDEGDAKGGEDVVVVVTVAAAAEKKTRARSGSASTEAAGRMQRTSPPRLRRRVDDVIGTHTDTKASKTNTVAESGSDVDEDSPTRRAGCTKVAQQKQTRKEAKPSADNTKQASLSDSDSNGDDDDDDDGRAYEDVAPFATPYYCLINYSENLVFVNRTAVLTGHSVRLEEGDVVSLLECAFGTDGGVLDAPKLPAEKGVFSSDDDSASVWVLPSTAALAATQELPGLEAWARLAIDTDANKAAASSPARRVNEEGEEEEDTDGEEGPFLSQSSALVVGDRVVAARRPLEVSVALSYLISLWRHLVTLSRSHASKLLASAATLSHSVGASPAPVCPRSRSRSVSPTTSTVPLNDSASASRVSRSHRLASAASPSVLPALCSPSSSLWQGVPRAVSMMTVEHNHFALSPSTHRTSEASNHHDDDNNMRDKNSARGIVSPPGDGQADRFAHLLPPRLEDWTNATRAAVLAEVEVALEAFDGGVQDAVQAVHSPLAPSLTLEAASARRAFAALTKTLLSYTTQTEPRAQTGVAARELFASSGTTLAAEPVVKQEPEEENEVEAEAVRRPDARVKKEEKDSETCTSVAMTPLKRLVAQLCEANEGTEEGVAIARAGGGGGGGSVGASPGRLIWSDMDAAKDADKTRDDVWRGDGQLFFTDDDEKEEGEAGCRDGASHAGVPKKDADDVDAQKEEEEEAMAPFSVAGETAPFVRLEPALLPVYVFTRRANSPERCLRETSSWRQRRPDGSWASEEAGAVYYYYESEEEGEGKATTNGDGEDVEVREVTQLVGHDGDLDEVKASTALMVGGSGEGRSAAAARASPDSLEEEPVWIDQTRGSSRRRGATRRGRGASGGGGGKSRRRRRD